VFTKLMAYKEGYKLVKLILKLGSKGSKDSL